MTSLLYMYEMYAYVTMVTMKVFLPEVYILYSTYNNKACVLYILQCNILYLCKSLFISKRTPKNVMISFPSSYHES